jgi:quinol-cytochrome oxidoreductase complex cytochrome b subunit
VTSEPALRRQKDRLRLATAAAVGVVGAEIVVLIATGAWLTWHYLPVQSGVRIGHRVAAFSLVPSLLVATVLVAASLARRPGGGGWRHLLYPASIAFALVASATGFLLPWDQLALWAVTTGRDYQGFTWLIDDRRYTVRFAIAGGAEVSNSLLRTLLVVHVVGGVLVIGAVATVTAQALRSAGGGPKRPSA